MDRRCLLKGALVASAAVALRQPVFGSDHSEVVELQINPRQTTATMPADFIGLSYETPQLSNPSYFSAANRQLVDAFRALSPKGVLRLGGALSDYTFWSESPATERLLKFAPDGRAHWEWKLADPQTQREKGLTTTPAAIRNLKEFLDATNWTLIYGLNFGTGTPEQAAQEAACVSRTMGPRLLAFQIGNEADFFADGKRPKPWGFQEYFADWQRFAEAVLRKVPDARFGGPDVAVNMAWVEALAQQRVRNLAFVSGHYYAMGPAKDPQMNAERLLGPNEALLRYLKQAKSAAVAGGCPFRMTETNSCFGGGKPEVSDSYASALWGADYLLLLAQAGVGGVNVHGGGDGIYTPIAGHGETFHRRPLYFGMQLAREFAGAAFHPVTLFSANWNGTAYCASRQGGMLVAVLNRESRPVTLQCLGIPEKYRTRRLLRMSAQSLNSKSVEYIEASQKPRGRSLFVPPLSAALLQLG